MKSLERMGEAQLLAREGQLQIASVLVRMLKRAMDHIFTALGRRSPDAPIF